MNKNNNSPLILSFYLDREIINNSMVMQFISDSVNAEIERKKANVIAFFLPTDSEERVECLNPIQLTKPDMDKVNKLVSDIAEKFDMGKKRDLRDYSFLNKKDCTFAFKSEWDYLGCKEFKEIYDNEGCDVTLITVINKLATSLSLANQFHEINKIRLHSCFKELFTETFYSYLLPKYEIIFDDSLEIDVIYIYSDEYFKPTYVPRRVGDKYEMIKYEEATEGEISELKRRLWGYIKIVNYEGSNRI